MSKVISKIVQLVPTELGNMVVTQRLIKEYDVEDMLRAGAEAQARAVQMQNIGNILQAQPSWPQGMIPTAFKAEDNA